MTDIEDRVRAALHGVAETDAGDYATVGNALARRRRRRGLATASLAALLVVGGVVAVGGTEPDRVTVATPPGPAAPGQWVAIQPEPTEARFQHQAVWTGKEAVILGGYGQSSDSILRSGAAFDPSKRAWRRIADAPIEVAVAAWTGTEVLALGGDGPVRSAAWDPATDRWRDAGEVPLTSVASSGTYLVKAGDEMLAVGQFGARDGERGGLPGPLLRYDLHTRSWRVGPAPEDLPIFAKAVWTGSQLWVLGAFGLSGVKGAIMQVAVWDAARDTWATKYPYPASDTPGRIAAVGDSGAVVAGLDDPQAGRGRRAHRVHMWLASSDAAPATGVFPPAPEAVQGQERWPDMWTGSHLVAFTAAGALTTLDTEASVWAVGSTPPEHRRQAPAVWTGEEVLVLGGGLPAAAAEGSTCCKPRKGGFAGSLP